MNQNWKVRATTCFNILGIATLLAIPARSDDKSAATYKQKCVACHGADGKGDTPTGKALGVHSFASAETSKMSDQELADVIEKGKGKMPKYGSSMKPEEIKAMVAYIRTLGK
jgi:mono/diheme cytochrome c family protein